MGTKSYDNVIREVEVSIAIERLLLANYPQAWTPSRIDFASLPGGYYDLGAVVEDTPSLRVSRSKFTLSTGVPAVRQFEAITAMDGVFECSLHSNSWRKVQLALGNYSYTSSPTVLSTIASVTSNGVITLAGSPTEAIDVGDTMVIATTVEKLDDIDAIETRVVSIVDATLHFSPVPAGLPIVDDFIANYAFVRQALGTSQIKHYSILGVADFIDGVQVVHRIAKCVPAEEIVEEIRPEQNQRIPLTFNAYGLLSSDYGSSDELIVAERFYFPKGA